MIEPLNATGQADGEVVDRSSGADAFSDPHAGPKAGTTPSGVPVEFDGVRKTYRSRNKFVPAVEDFSLSVAPGEFVTLVGPSGCGKSTLMLLLAGVVSASGGTIRVDGKTVDGPRGDLGIAFQRPLLLPWRTVRENVLLQPDLMTSTRARFSERADQLLDAVGLSQFAYSRPYELSGGMQARVSLCRALVAGAPLLLLDEPFAAVDALTREQLYVLLDRLRGETGATTLLVTHGIEEAVELSDRVVVMSSRPGRITKIVDVDLERPRDTTVRTREEFVAACATVRSAVSLE